METPSTQQSVARGAFALDLNDQRTLTVANEFAACRQVRVNVAGTYIFYFEGMPTTARTMVCAAGEILDYGIVKITASDGSAVATADVIHLIY